MVLIVQGIRFLYSGGMPKGQISEGQMYSGRASIFSIPMTVWICLAVGAISAVVLHATTLGRSIVAVGGNARTAYMSGVNTHRVLTIAYMISVYGRVSLGFFLPGG